VPIGEAASETFPEEVRRSLVAAVSVGVLAVILAKVFPFPPTKYVVALLVGGRVLLDLYRVPEVALVLLAFFLPVFDLFPPELFLVPGVNAQTGVGLLSIVGAVRLKQQSPGGLPFAGYFWALLAMGVLASLQTVYFYPGAAREVFTMTKNWLGYLPFFFFAGAACRTAWGRKLVTGAVLISATLVAGESVLDFLRSGGGASLRSAGLVGNQPNVYGGYLVLVLPLFVAFAVNGTGEKRFRLLCAAGTVLVTVALVFTKSRGAWVAFGGSLLIMILLRRQYKLAVLVLIVTIFAGSLLPAAFFERWDETVRDTPSDSGEVVLDRSTESRVKQWKAFPKLMVERPVLGHGLWTFGELIYSRGLYYRPIAPHSSIMRLGVEMGAVGLLLYFLLMAGLILGAARASRLATSAFDSSLLLGLLGTFVGQLGADVSGARLFNIEIFAIFTLLAGVLAGWIAQNQGLGSPAEEPAPPPSPLNRHRSRPRPRLVR
jgi:O-antigen ligase